MSFGGPLLLAPLSSLFGVRPGMNLSVHGAPEGFLQALVLPEGASLVPDAKTGVDMHIVFAEKKHLLVEALTTALRGMAVTGCIWVCFPSAADAMHTPTEEFARLAGLELGLTDVKKVMVGPAWTALKFQWKAKPPRPELPGVRA